MEGNFPRVDIDQWMVFFLWQWPDKHQSCMLVWSNVWYVIIRHIGPDKHVTLICSCENERENLSPNSFILYITVARNFDSVRQDKSVKTCLFTEWLCRMGSCWRPRRPSTPCSSRTGPADCLLEVGLHCTVHVKENTWKFSPLIQISFTYLESFSFGASIIRFFMCNQEEIFFYCRVVVFLPTRRWLGQGPEGGGWRSRGWTEEGSQRHLLGLFQGLCYLRHRQIAM